MSLSTFLCQLHEVNCSFRVSQSEVHDIESAVLEGLSFILDKGQTLKIEPFLGAKSTPASEEGRIVSYGDLFAVEKILPVGSFYEGTKNSLPDEFDFNIKINVGEIDIHQGCRPGRVRVTFERSRQNMLEDLSNWFSGMLEATLKAMTDGEKKIPRDSGTLHISSLRPSFTVPCLEFLWKGINGQFKIGVDVMPSIQCPDSFVEELRKDEHFPLDFHQLVKDRGCFLVPKPCSPHCNKCFHVSFAQGELYLMQSLDELHRKCYRVTKWLLSGNLLDSYQVKMAILDHVYRLKCDLKGSLDECVLAVLQTLLNNFNALKMPTFFLRSCCLITKDGEGKPRYLDYLVDATGLDMSKVPVMQTEFTELHSYKNYDWLDMFAWYEFQRRCLSLMIDVLRYFASKEVISRSIYRQRVTTLAVFFETDIGAISLPGMNGPGVMCGRPTMREWKDKVPNFSQRIFIPAFSLILEEIEGVLRESFSVPGVRSSPPIHLCLPCPVMGYSQGHTGSAQWKDPNGDLYLRQGVMCYFARLQGGSWCPAAFGKMSFIESFKESYDSFMLGKMASLQGGPSSQLVRGSSLKATEGNGSSNNEEIPDFEGPFHHNVRYDGEAFMEKIVTHWNYKHCLIRFLLRRMLLALYLTKPEWAELAFAKN